MDENDNESHLVLDTVGVDQTVQHDEIRSNDITIITNSYSIGHGHSHSMKHGRPLRVKNKVGPSLGIDKDR